MWLILSKIYKVWNLFSYHWFYSEIILKLGRYQCYLGILLKVSVLAVNLQWRLFNRQELVLLDLVYSISQ